MEDCVWVEPRALSHGGLMEGDTSLGSGNTRKGTEIVRLPSSESHRPLCWSWGCVFTVSTVRAAGRGTEWEDLFLTALAGCCVEPAFHVALSTLASGDIKRVLGSDGGAGL